MNKTTFLSGGGDPDVSFELDKEYFSLLKDNSKILYIPVALSKSKSFLGYESCREWFTQLIAKHSNGKTITFEMFTEEDVNPTLELFDSIFMGGGNTYYLLDFIYKKDLINKLVNYLKNGGMIYGGSAGAIVLGSDISTVAEENDKNYEHHKGLNLLNGMAVICHYKEELDTQIKNTAKLLNTEIYAIPEESGLILSNTGEVQDIVGKVFVFNSADKR